ncbi:MAG TPA: hypothetical protein VLT33_10350 [Labilithrix sp.]|nr:hypothetical protein [Labilithrix sp.]
MATNFERLFTATVGLLFAATLAVVPACSSSSSDASPAEPPVGNAGIGTLPLPNADVDPPADIKLHPDVVVIHGGLSVLHKVSDDHGVWTLDKSAAGVASLVPGKIVLLAGLDVARVTAVADRGAEVDLSVTPVGFAEVITDGTVSWDKGAIDPSRSVIIRAPNALYEGDTATASVPVKSASLEGGLRPLAAPQDSSVRIQLADGWTITFSAKQSGDSLDLIVGGQRSVGGGSVGVGNGGTAKLGALEIGVNAKAHIVNVRNTSGSLTLSGGAMNDATINADLAGTVDVDATAKTHVAGQYPSQALIRIPISVEYPFPCLAGLPCYFSVQLAFLIQPSLPTIDSGLGVAGHFEFGGTAGMSLGAGTATKTGQATSVEPSNLLQQATVVPSAATTAMVFAVQAPRFGIGLGTLSAVGGAKIGVFADVVNSFAITVASATALVPCRGLNWNLSASVGGEMSVKVFESVTINQQHKFEVYKAKKDFYDPDIAACHL